MGKKRKWTPKVGQRVKVTKKCVCWNSVFPTLKIGTKGTIELVFETGENEYWLDVYYGDDGPVVGKKGDRRIRTVSHCEDCVTPVPGRRPKKRL